MRTSIGVLAAGALLTGCADAPIAGPSSPPPSFARAGASATHIVWADAPGRATSAMARLGITPAAVYSHALHGGAVVLSTADSVALVSAGVRVESNGVIQAFDTQSSPPSWGIDRIDQRTLPLSGSYTYPASAGAGVHVYELDTGINPNHQEFGGRASMVPIDFTAGPNGENDGWVKGDCNGHGTHVAGTVGGATTGVAKAVTLHGLRVLGCGGQGDWGGFLAALDWVVQNGQRPGVITISAGGYFAPSAVDEAIENTIAAGVPVVVAAGNATAGDDACKISPASAPSAITVMASGSNDARAYFSNYGPCTDLYAPGYLIYSSYSSPINDPAEQECNSCYATLSGTSMATPHVTGAVALLLAENPALTPAELTAAILGNATLGVVTGNPSGTPNRLLFTLAGELPPEPPPPPPPTQCPPGTRPLGHSGKCK